MKQYFTDQLEIHFDKILNLKEDKVLIEGNEVGVG